MDISNIESVNNVNGNILELRNYLAYKITSTKTRKDYFIYKELYNTLLTSHYVKDIFGIDNEDTTFEKVLADCSPELYMRYISIEDYITEFESATNTLERSLSNMSNLSFIMGMDTSGLIDSLFKILNFFKSAKAELVGYNVVYTLTAKGVSYIKFLDLMSRAETISNLEHDEFYLIDLMELMNDYYKFRNDYIYMLKDDVLSLSTKRTVESFINLFDDKVKALFYDYRKSIIRGDILHDDSIYYVSNIIFNIIDQMSTQDKMINEKHSQKISCILSSLVDKFIIRDKDIPTLHYIDETTYHDFIHAINHDEIIYNSFCMQDILIEL
jgi:hypothetical protein